MKKGVKVFLIIILVILLVLNLLANGFLFSSKANVDCWDPPCLCQFRNVINGEASCDICLDSKHIIVITGILNVYKECDVNEIITCQEGAQIDSRIDTACKYSWNILWFFP